MAELATIARPYAEALFKAAGADGQALLAPVHALSQVAAQPALQQFADDPKVSPAQVVELVLGALGEGVDPRVANLLRVVADNGRVSALPAIAAQFQALVNARAGVLDAKIFSAFPVEGTQLDEVVAALEKRFGQRLQAKVEIDPELIGGIRVVVGDEVLDTSVKARLEQMKASLTA